MKIIQITFFIIFSTLLITQTVQHMHLYIYGSELSILAPYETFSNINKSIQREESTDLLLTEFGKTNREIKELEELDTTKNNSQVRKENPALFARNSALRIELRKRETNTKNLRDVWIYSIVGYILIGIGVLLYYRGRQWTGLSLILPGFIELTWWSSPSFSGGAAFREYEALLGSKLILTAIALILLYILWWTVRVNWRRNPTHKH